MSKIVLAALALIFFCLLVFLPWSEMRSSDIQLSATLQAPSLRYPLGTDNLGRDLVVRVASVMRDVVLPIWTSVLLATIGGVLIAVLVMIGLPTRLAALINYILLVFTSVPVTILVFALTVWYGRTGLLPLCVGFALVFFLRSMVQLLQMYWQDEHLGYWQANAALGGSRRRRVWLYGVWGRWLRPIVEMGLFHMQIALIIEVGLSYLGFGVQEPMPSFGNMLASHFELYLRGQWTTLVIIIVAMVFVAQIPKSISAVLSPITSRHRRVKLHP